jgi:hypothetical protein
MKAWNTLRIAMYGALAGVCYQTVPHGAYLAQGPEFQSRFIGGLFGAALGGALLGAIISGLRNLFVRPVR